MTSWSLVLAACTSDALVGPETFNLGPEGGRLEFLDGQVVLDAPAGAVAQPTAITVRQASGEPQRPTLVVNSAYDLGPDGLKFESAVILTVQFDLQQLPSGVRVEELRMYKVVDNAWQEIVGSAGNTQNTVSAAITSFSVYGILGVPVATINIEPPDPSISASATVQLSANVVDADQNPLPERVVVWSSDDANVATVDDTGLLTGKGVGTTTISATSEGMSGTTTVTVSATPVATIEVAPTEATLNVNQTVQLASTTSDSAGNVLTGRLVEWSSSNTDIATVDGSGLVTGISLGDATITATSEGQSAAAQITVAANPTATLELIASGLSSPVYVTTPPGDTERLFIVEQGGSIVIVDDGSLLSTPFLNIEGEVNCCGEQGLLSVAFHPNYDQNGQFFVYYTLLDSDNSRIARYTVSSNPNVADDQSALEIMTVEQPFGNHNGGLLKFGPDGFLYIGLGDGGSGGDPFGHGQDSTTLLGSILRIDVDGGSPYAIPADNPFLGAQDARPEIWAYGLRNPWRYSFDRSTGDLYIGDVGQGDWEEIDVQLESSSGRENYGWNTMEGSNCFGSNSCDAGGLVLPVHEYSHDSGNCSVTGGYVYRGSRSPSVTGHYFYADYCVGAIRSFRFSSGAAVEHRDWTPEFGTVSSVSSFGEDANGELYVVSLGGSVYRINLGT